jgi:hypothetical protein
MILKNLIRNFTTIPNEIIVDKTISNGSFRLYCYLASKPTNWEVNNTDIKKQLGIGTGDTLAKYWKELIKSGWVEKEPERDEKGKFTGRTIYILHESPKQKDSESGENPESVTFGYPSPSDIRQSMTHNNTDNINNTEFNNNNKGFDEKKSNESDKEDNEPSPLLKLAHRIRRELMNRGINLDSRKTQELDLVIYRLSKSYSLDVIENVFLYGLNDDFFKKLVVVPKSFGTLLVFMLLINL